MRLDSQFDYIREIEKLHDRELGELLKGLTNLVHINIATIDALETKITLLKEKIKQIERVDENEKI
jgi:hypothetical protein